MLVRPKPKRTVKTQAPTKPVEFCQQTYDSEIEKGGHAFDGLLGTQFDQLCAADCDPDDVGEDVVGDYQADWEEEPDHALKDVVHDEVGLHHDQVQGHVCPSELRELELVVALLQRADEEDKACDCQQITLECIPQRTYP
jgi:hypothetical protein